MLFTDGVDWTSDSTRYEDNLAMIEEAGGTVTDLDGGAGYFRGGNVVAGGREVHRGLWEVIAGHACEAELDRLNPVGAA